MAIKITITEWEIPSGNDCEFADGKPCPLLGGWEYCGNGYCQLERGTALVQSKRQTWKKTETCKARG